MLDFDVQERWPPKHCNRKWQELEGAASLPQSAAMTPSVSHYSSPGMDQPMQYRFMPLQ